MIWRQVPGQDGLGSACREVSLEPVGRAEVCVLDLLVKRDITFGIHRLATELG